MGHAALVAHEKPFARQCLFRERVHDLVTPLRLRLRLDVRGQAGEDTRNPIVRAAVAIRSS